MIQHLPERLDFVVFNGDLIQAVRPPWGGSLIAPNCDDQAACIVELLRPIRERSRQFYITSGTGYHNIDVGDYEQQIAKKLHAKYSDHLDLQVENKTINFVHGHTSGFVYRAGAIEREIFFGALAEALKQTPHADVVIRSHIHMFCGTIFDNRLGFFTPGWQLPDSYQSTRAASFYKTMPTLGAFILQVDDGPMPDAIRVVRAPYQYPMPTYRRRVERL